MSIIPVKLRKGDDTKIADPQNPLHHFQGVIQNVVKNGLDISIETLFAYCLL